MKSLSKPDKVMRLVEAAAQKMDAKGIPTRELGSHYLTAANAVKAGNSIPAKSAKAIR